METLKRTTKINPRECNNSGLDHFEWMFRESVKVNPAAVSHAYDFDVDIYERHEVDRVKKLFSVSVSVYVKEVLVGCQKVYHVLMINGDEFYSLDEPEFLK